MNLSNLIKTGLKENFILDYLDIDWNSTFDKCGLDPNLCFNTFNSKIKDLLDLHLPTVKLTKRQCKTQLKPWITSGIIRLIKYVTHIFGNSLRLSVLKPKLTIMVNLNYIEIE